MSAPGSAGGREISAGVRLKRGAGAGCRLPSTATNVPRATLCGCRGASCSASTAVAHASSPSSTAAHCVARAGGEHLGETRLELGPPRLVPLREGVGVQLQQSQQRRVELWLERAHRDVPAVARGVDLVEVRAGVEQVGAGRVRPHPLRAQAVEDAHQQRAAVDHRGVDDLALA